MAGPLLVVDTPSMLFRAFYALPDSIVGTDGKPVNALLGTANLSCGRSRSTGRAPSSSASVPTPPPTGPSSTPPTTPSARRRCPTSWHPSSPPRETSSPLSAGPSPPARTSRPTTCSAPTPSREAEAGGHALLLTGDRDMYQCAAERVTVLYVKTGGKGKGAEEVGPAEVRERYGIPPSAGSRLHRPARRSLRRPPGAKGVGPEDRGRAAAPPRLARGRARERDPRAPPGPARSADRDAPTTCSPSRTSPPCETRASNRRPTARRTGPRPPRPPTSGA